MYGSPWPFQEKTTEYSFMLKPSQIEGVGVFAVTGLPKERLCICLEMQAQ